MEVFEPFRQSRDERECPLTPTVRSPALLALGRAGRGRAGQGGMESIQKFQSPDLKKFLNKQSLNPKKAPTGRSWDIYFVFCDLHFSHFCVTMRRFSTKKMPITIPNILNWKKEKLKKLHKKLQDISQELEATVASRELEQDLKK